jgi:hypothetical protein
MRNQQITQLMTLVSVLNLFLQLVVLVILIVGIMLVKQERSAKGIKRHLYLTATALVLIAVSMILVMVPSLIAYFSSPPGSLTTFGVVSLSGHALFGGITFVIGIAFVLNKKPKNVKSWMRAQASLWSIAFLFGIIEFLQVSGII